LKDKGEEMKSMSLSTYQDYNYMCGLMVI